MALNNTYKEENMLQVYEISQLQFNKVMVIHA